LDRGAAYEADRCGFKSRRARQRELSKGKFLPPGGGWVLTPRASTLGGEVMTRTVASWSAMKEIMEEGGVDLNDEGLIERESLYEFNECAALILHWND
jgi:hypothetical protein